MHHIWHDPTTCQRPDQSLKRKRGHTPSAGDGHSLDAPADGILYVTKVKEKENKVWCRGERHKVFLSWSGTLSSRKQGREKLTEGDVEGQTALLTHSVMYH